MSSTATALVVCALILAGSLGGALLRRALPDHHLSGDARDVIRLGSGLVATISALVLGLLISSAKSSYDVQRNEVRQMTTNIILLDRVLERYGPEARLVRVFLRRGIDPLIAQIWHDRNGAPAAANPIGSANIAYDTILALSPQSEAQHLLKAQALQLLNGLGQTRTLLSEQSDGSIPLPFLAVLVFWLAIIFGSFSLMSSLNPTTGVALLVFALSAAGAIFLILEMDQPFSGLMQIPSAPLRAALQPLVL